MSLDSAAALFVDWLHKRVVVSGRGDELTTLDNDPRGRFWLGSLAPASRVANSVLGDRAERMEPCAIGIRVLPSLPPPWEFVVNVEACGWHKPVPGGPWGKTQKVTGRAAIRIESARSSEGTVFAIAGFVEEFARILSPGILEAVVEVDVTRGKDHVPELVVRTVNTSAENPARGFDPNLYEVSMTLTGLPTKPYLLESLPDSYRYDRRVSAYGINCALETMPNGGFHTRDDVAVDRHRPKYWNSPDPEPDLRFSTLSKDPLPALRAIVSAHKKWGDHHWSSEVLDERSRSESWSPEMRLEAADDVALFQEEASRMKSGLTLLESDETLRRAFQLMNEAIAHSSRGRYDGWRPFQVGFLLANVDCLSGEGDDDIADILWFATGGGKTETYLELLIMAALHDRMTGKLGGITAWSRFPLRLLSLQQTQRFADALAGAEIVRKREKIGGAPFSIGFFVGDENTPNRVEMEPKSGAKWDPDDASMPSRCQLLLRCPFCHGEDIEMEFDRAAWRLVHLCRNPDCAWGEAPLPISVVDEEIYRYLPTVIVGTLDKVALIAMQAAARGLFGAPLGICSEAGHGYVYASRSTKPNGCLVPGCQGQRGPLRMAADRYAPTFRLQDELHLLRDSLGAIDSHYESLLDHLQKTDSGKRSKIVGSSATLSGFENQCENLYGRRGRVFPFPGPTATSSFWTAGSAAPLRRLVALPPRGNTLEYAADQLLTELQRSIRRLKDDTKAVCQEAGIEEQYAEALLSLYGTNVVYGNTIRDLDAVTRSLETQVPVTPLISAQLTGQTPFDDIRRVLGRLEKPEVSFDERIHIVAASSMMSHGVDIDRLNVMVMLGVPLTTAEFIQTTARIGRRYPGLVFVLHKMALERDAGILRSFEHFVKQGDRFVEPIPISRRSRRVLQRTISGLAFSRVLHVHEPASGTALTTVRTLKDYFSTAGITAAGEAAQVVEMLKLDPDVDDLAVNLISEWYDEFFANLRDNSSDKRFPQERSPTGRPMLSLRDVEQQAPVHDR